MTAAANTGVKAVAADVYLGLNQHVQTLSYLIPSGMEIEVGQAVLVPVNNFHTTGMVVSLNGSAGKATRMIEKIIGIRASKKDVGMALLVADHHFVEREKVLRRLSPAKGRGAAAALPGSLRLRRGAKMDLPKASAGRRLLVRQPLTPGEQIAANEAVRISKKGQVLILCPTIESVIKTYSQFSAGAVRLDAGAPEGHWAAFRDGGAKVGIGTRVAALYSPKELGGVIVVDEENSGHVEVSQPYTHARDLASSRCRIHGAELTLISAAPTPSGQRAVSAVSVVAGKWPTVILADRTEGDGDLVTPTMKAAQSRASKAGMETLILAYTAKSKPRCYQCGEMKEDAKDTCARCGSDKTRLVGWDSGRLRSAFGKTAEVATPAKASKSAKPRLVIVFDIDAALFTPTLTPHRAAADLIVSACELAGSGGEVVLGSFNPDNLLLREVSRGGGLLPWADRATEWAFQDLIPPARRMVTVTFERKTAPDLTNWPGMVSGPKNLKDGLWEAIIRIPSSDLLSLDGRLRAARKNSRAKVRVD